MVASQIPFAVALASIFLVGAIPAQQTLQAAPGLRLLSRVRVVESDALFLSRPAEIALGPSGHVYVTEENEARVLDLAPNGTIARAFGRKGQGPGEFMSPSTLEVLGDSMLVVHDRVQRRLTFIGLKAWKFERAWPSPQAWPPFLRAVGPTLFAGVWDLDSRTSLARIGPEGELLQREGVYPEIGIKHPMLIRGAFYRSAFAMSDGDVFAIYEVSPSIHRWKRGAKTGTEIPLPRKSRRGLDPSIFEQMLQDPGNNARNQKLYYDRSIPVTMEFVADGVLAVVTMDYSMDADSQTVAFHVTVLDLLRNRACVDLPVPLARQSMSMRDGIPRIAMRNDRLAVLEQGLDARGESAPTLSMYKIEPASCR
jgi:hypothetical protein